jgi:hypothetical protein
MTGSQVRHCNLYTRRESPPARCLPHTRPEVHRWGNHIIQTNGPFAIGADKVHMIVVMVPFFALLAKGI